MERKALVRDLCILLVGFVGMVLCVIVVSLVEKYVIPAFSAEAYGLETESSSVFVMPEDPILKIYAYEKDENEIQTSVQLSYLVPINSGPPLYWQENICTWKSESMLNWNGEIPLAFQFEGRIEIEFMRHGEEIAYSCFTGKTNDFLPDLEKAQYQQEKAVIGTNEFSVILVGIYWRDISTYKTLAQAVSGSTPSVYSSIRQYQDTVSLHVTCYDVVDSTVAATAVLEVKSTSEWINAGAESRIYQGNVLVGYDESLLYYAQVKPTWTIELVEYWQREG